MTNGGSLKIFSTMMKRMDLGIGRVLKAIDRANLTT
jgi:hypothetical protein